MYIDLHVTIWAVVCDMSKLKTHKPEYIPLRISTTPIINYNWIWYFVMWGLYKNVAYKTILNLLHNMKTSLAEIFIVILMRYNFERFSYPGFLALVDT